MADVIAQVAGLPISEITISLIQQKLSICGAILLLLLLLSRFSRVRLCATP